MVSKIQKERAQKVIPRGTRKKGELRKVSKWHQKSKRKSTWDFHIFSEKCAGHVSGQVSGQVSGHVSVQNWNFFGLRGHFPYCKLFVLASTKREPSKQSLWEKQTCSTRNDPVVLYELLFLFPKQCLHYGVLACWMLVNLWQDSPSPGHSRTRKIIRKQWVY